MRKHFIIIIIAFSCLTNVYSQKGLELGGDIGMAWYFGDLNTSYDLSKPGFALGLKARQNFNERLSISGGFQFAHVSASDANSNNFFEKNRNLDFRSNTFDFNASLEFNFFPYKHGSKDNYYTPYLFTGFSIMKFNPKTDLDGTTYALRDFGTEGQFINSEYHLVSAAFLYGFGFKWDLNKDWSINTQITGRKLVSDYIDDVSGTYPEFVGLETLRGPVAVQLSNKAENSEFVSPGLQRGNGKNNDVIYILSIGLMRYFGQLQCPSISNPAY
ncbi:MAG: porin family protein [Bacteroidia bacterium]|nr:porin family protein [Bacteroidia bacterium]NNK90347.1 outer membrane beta-barrel protein [Saprospiraceae bacterium]